MAKKKKNKKIYAHVEVLQNGEIVAEHSTSLAKGKKISIGATPKASLTLPFYPLSCNLDFAELKPEGAVLDIGPVWEGFLTSEGELVTIASDERRNHLFELGTGDIANLYYNDLNVLIKFGPKQGQKKTKLSQAKRYRPGLLSLLLPTKADIKYTAISAAVVALFVFAPILTVVELITVKRPEILTDLDPKFVRPFIYHEHLRNAPEAIQSELDRSRFEQSVIDYVGALADTIYGWPVRKPEFMFPDSIRRFQDYHKSQQTTIDEFSSKQRSRIAKMLIKPLSSVITIPSVKGESIRGRIYRIFEKIDISMESHAINLENRRKFIVDFPEDGGYSYTGYQGNTAANREHRKKLAKISPFKVVSDRKSMYQEAEHSAGLAETRQRVIEQGSTEKEPLDMEELSTIAISPDVDFVNFLTEASLLADDSKISQIRASYYGKRRKTKPKEPLIGEIDPKLIENTIAKRQFELQLCYELALRRNDAARGEMEWSWRINSRGRISDLALVSTTFSDNRMVKCVRRKMARWTFPRPRRGSVEVRFPFQFSKSRG